MRIAWTAALAAGLMVAPAVTAVSQDVPRTTGGWWNAEALGNHRAVVRVEADADAVQVHVPWRRRDAEPERKLVILVDAATGGRVTNLVAARITREAGDLVFQPSSGPGDYYAYYLPFVSAGSRNYPKVTYRAPEDTADVHWKARHGLGTGDDWQRLPRARTVEFQAVEPFHSFDPMEVIATAEETAALVAKHPGAAYLTFGEDRTRPIRMTGDLPKRWVDTGANAPFRGTAARSEFFAFQVGVFAVDRALQAVGVRFTDFAAAKGGARLAAATFRCFNTGGIDSAGVRFDKRVDVAVGTVQALWMGAAIPERAQPGDYTGAVVIAPAGLPETRLPVTITVTPEAIATAGDDEPWRHSRLRWLDSTLAFDDEVVAPFTPMTVEGRTVGVLGRRVALGDDGLPARIESLFSPEMTYVGTTPRPVLARPISLVVERADGAPVAWAGRDLRFTRQAKGAVAWRAERRAGALSMTTDAVMDFDGNIEFAVRLQAASAAALRDVRLEIPMVRDVAKYMLGMGRKGGLRPATLDWTWDVRHNQDGAWIGDVNAGLQFSLKDEHYVRPLNTNFYTLKPLVMPRSWANDGKGGCRLADDEAAMFLVRCQSGERTMTAGETLRFDFRLLLTPFKPLDTDFQWRTRFYHRYASLDQIQATGANTVNVHHATPVNPWINYPFFTPGEMKAYVDQAHTRGMKVKIYYTVRELSNRAPEVFALRSLGDEVLAGGPGGGPSWLQEHLGGNYIAGWLVPDLQDAAIINSGVSRWHNYYVEGLDWLVRNVGIDGLYIDDVAFDRLTMKRVRKVLDRGRPGAMIDLHSANQFNPRDGFANSANLYLEHFPYIHRLWFGEYFDYDSPPDFWMTELSGIPFGLMGEMLQDNGNPWRGMVYGMTQRLPWAGDPSPLWRAWDAFGMDGTRMVGHWVDGSPVKTGRADVLATAYLKAGKAMVAIASWAPTAVDVSLKIDWRALGIDPASARISAPAIEAFQPARTFRMGQAIPVEPGKGWLLVIDTPR